LRLEAAGNAQGIPALAHLAPGLDETRIERALSAVGLEPVGEVLSVFGWHDGFRREDMMPGDWNINPRGLRLLTLEDAVSAYGEYFRHHKNIRDEMDLTGWFPIFAWGPGFVTVHCEHPDAGTHETWLWDPWTGEEVAVPSLDLPLSWWITFLETGAWRWTPRGWLDTTQYESLTQLQRESALC
jgi:hypothetical protein